MRIEGRFNHTIQKHMKIHKLFINIIFVMLLFSGIKAVGQKIYIDENISYWTDINNEIHVTHSVFTDVDSVHILMEISFLQGNKYDNYDFLYELHKSYHTLDILDSDTINIEGHIIAIKAGKIIAYFKVANSEKTDLAVIKIVNKKSGIDYAYDIPLMDDYNYSSDGLVFYEEDGITPMLSSFVNVNSSLQLKSINAHDEQVFVYYYSQYFDEAVPPMIIEDQRASKGLTIDSVFMVQLNEPFTLKSEGLYFFQKDSSSAKGISVRIQDAYYPLTKTFESVLEPLIYISTRTETEAIRNARDPKKAFEDYWINLVKIPNLATSTVKKYYDRVEAANYLFTNFEEGWKSDMGMIYIVYGPPNDVYKSEEIIDWVYNRDLTMPVIRFSFYKVKNVFTDHHYTLLRKKTYDKNWFKSVELWRDGKK